MDLPKEDGADYVSRLEITMYLLKAELKHRKFMHSLEQVGFDTTLWSLDFSSMILSLIGFASRSDAIYETYNRLLESFVERFNLQDEIDNLDELASDFYAELVSEKSRM